MKLPTDAETGEPKPGDAKIARVLTAIVGMALVVPVVWIGGTAFNALASLLAVAGLRELVVAARRSASPLVPEVVYPALGLLLVAHWQSSRAWGGDSVAQHTLMLIAASNFLIPMALLGRAVWKFGSKRPISLASVALSHLAVNYCGLFAFIMLLRGLPNDYGMRLFWLVLLGVWAGDTLAYYGGKLFGRHKLTPLSPGKTREGALCGIAATLVVCLCIAWAWPLPFQWWDKIAVAALVALFAPLGDLAESLLKRELDVKDLGRALPGHGGILDRCDSLLFAALPVYFYALWRILP
ncbi:MAG TPA: phosphatidate cytidylyltransferase [Abditibacteriaceae bacterium]